MHRRSIPICWLTVLVAGALLLPIALVVVLAVAGLLAGMDDAAGAAMLRRVGLAAGVFWVIDLVTLVIAQGIQTLLNPPGAGEDEPPDELPRRGQ